MGLGLSGTECLCRVSSVDDDVLPPHDPWDHAVGTIQCVTFTGNCPLRDLKLDYSSPILIKSEEAAQAHRVGTLEHGSWGGKRPKLIKDPIYHFHLPLTITTPNLIKKW